METNQFTKLIEIYFDKFQSLLPKLLLTVIILIFSSWLIKKLNKLIDSFLHKKQLNESLIDFIIKGIKITLYSLVIMIIISYLGFDTSSLLAVLGTIGLGIGLAVQGSLGNVVGGISILILKPFEDGDYIEVNNEEGYVEKVQLYNTKIVTFDNEVKLIPNATIINSNITNYSSKGSRRINLNIGISYESDLLKAKSLMIELVKSHPKVLKFPEAFCVVKEIADSSINLSAKVYVKVEDFWDVKFELQEQLKLLFDKHEINIPYPQMEISIKKNASIHLNKS